MFGVNQVQFCMLDVLEIFRKHLKDKLFIDTNFEIESINFLSNSSNYCLTVTLKGTEKKDENK